MKDVALIMEQISKKTYIHLLYLYLVEITALCGFILLDFRHRVFETIMVVIGLVALYVVHQKRIKEAVSGGAMNRILLLPLKRYSYVCSELLFTFTTILLYFLIFYIVWFGVQFFVTPNASWGYIIQLSHQYRCFGFLIPEGGLHLIVIFLYMFMITLQSVSLGMSIALKEKVGTGGFVWASYLVMMYGFSIETSPLNAVFVLSLIAVETFLGIGEINRFVGFKRKKGIS